MSYHKIKSFEVKGGFLDGVKIDFDDSLNCLIGGRGTGKTSILELIRWTLDHMPPETDNMHRNIDRLIRANLGTGQVTIGIETMDGLRYNVRRTYGDNPLVLGDKGEPCEIDIGRGNIFSIEVYSQNQIEEIANDPLFQLKLVDKFVIEKIKNINSQVHSCVRDIEANAGDILKMRREMAELKEQITELPEVTEKLKAFKAEDAGEEGKTLQRESAFKAIRDREGRFFNNLQRVLSKTETDFESVASELSGQIAECFDEEIFKGQNELLIRGVKALIDTGLHEMSRSIQEAVRISKTTREQLLAKTTELQAAHLKQEKVYQDLLEKFEKEKGKVKERDSLIRKQSQLLEGQKKLAKRREELIKKETDRGGLIRRLSDLKDERFRLRSDVAETLSSKLAPTIRIRIEQYGNVDDYRTLVLESMKGSGVKYVHLVDRLVQRIPPHEFAAIVQRADVQALKDQLEIDADRANRMILQLRDSKAVFDIEVVELHDRPTIELKDGKDYKDSTSLSTGQKCTTILPILLLESVSPLLIDQPEDNLDNAFIYETVVKSLREVRGKRQLIFVTHNPNIPVLGDAQEVSVLRSTGRQASLAATGTVDKVKGEIETILEGGKEAFQKRKERYGY